MKNLILKTLACASFALIIVSGVFAQNYKIRQTMTMNGQKSETTTYVRGARQRTEGGGYMGMGADVATVQQCDLKRNLTISDKKRMYAVEPFDNGADTSTPASTGKTTGRTKPAPVTKGGVVTYVSNVTDTGERKQMFGLTARHVKTSMTVESSPNACSPSDMKTDTDGWYVDLPQFSCPIDHPSVPQMGAMEGDGGCRDQIKFRTTGAGKLGFPLTETRTMKIGGDEDAMSMSQSTETLEFSKATLDAALFDIPQGYTLTASPQDLYGKPDMSAMMRGMENMNDDDEDKPKNNLRNSSGNNSMSSINKPIGAKKSGTIRIGVYAPTNKNGEDISTTNMQAFLVQKLSGGNVEAVPIGSESDAKSANCDYVLTSDFSKLKQSSASKIGGMFGKVTGTDVSAAKNYEAQVDFKLVAAATGKTAAQNKGMSKGEANVDRAAENALSQAASAILSAAK